METKYAELNYEQIIDIARNKPYEEILGITRYLQECIRQYFSKLLMDTSAKSPLECDIIVDTAEDVGISDSLKPHLTGMYQDPSEGIVYLEFEGDEQWYELEYFALDYQVDILRAIESNNKILEICQIGVTQPTKQ